MRQNVVPQGSGRLVVRGAAYQTAAADVSICHALCMRKGRAESSCS